MKGFVKVFLICSGLGEVQRGYESFTRECFETLKSEAHLELFLFKGGGKSDSREITLFNFKRRYFLTRVLGKLFNKDPYFFEQLSFTFSLLPYILIKQPDTIFFSDFAIGGWLAHFRNFMHLKYKLIFSNGAPNGPPYPLFDRVQHVTQVQYQEALAYGEPPERNFALPYGFEVPDMSSAIPSKELKPGLRRQLGLPSDKKIILSVGNINSTHKRMDYLIREFHELYQSDQACYLLILGHISSDSQSVIKLAERLLTPSSYCIKTVPFEKVVLYYQAVDIFALASQKEGFGRVFLEAMIYGLPVFAHDYTVAREVMQDQGIYIDMSLRGNLSEALKTFLEKPENHSTAEQRHLFVRQKYSWTNLKKEYLHLLCSFNE